jgi:hypothetical protein
MTQCGCCGKFCRPVEWKLHYSGVLPEPDHEEYRCATCVKQHGSFEPDPRIRPEASCGKFCEEIGRVRASMGSGT